MRFYNTLTKKLEEFKSIENKKVRMYVCGPTVYNYIHIGNARPIVVFDCLRRYLEFLGYTVEYVQNYTDIDDKLIKRAKDENMTVELLANKYIKEYELDAKMLNVLKPTKSPRVTENIDAIIDVISRLIAKNCAYVVQGNVYFNTLSFSEYGKLSKMPLSDLEKGNLVESSNLKRNALDFALWKASKEREPFWRAQWGAGMPGGHIECSAMALRFLGDTIDIHCGGQDLIFPHHENEIAQSECATSKQFSNYWLHNGHVNVDGSKMSKSLGNFFTVREIGSKYGYEALRYFILQAHYKTPINYTKDSMEQSLAALQRIYNFKSSIDLYIKNASEFADGVDVKSLLSYRERFINSLDEDFNTALAISVIFEFIRAANSYISKQGIISKATALTIKNLFSEFVDILGIAQNANSYNIPEEILDIFENRNAARENKDFLLADKLREELENRGYVVKETRYGSVIYSKG